MYKGLAFILILFLALSCKKEEGYGGTSEVHGKVFAINKNSNGITVSEGYLGEVRIYISKKNDPNYFDDSRTSFNGSFVFESLHPGDYDIWVFGDCDYCSWSQNYELKSFTVSKKKEKVIVEDFKIII